MYRNIFTSIIISILLTACGGGGDDEIETPDNPTPDYELVGPPVPCNLRNSC